MKTLVLILVLLSQYCLADSPQQIVELDKLRKLTAQEITDLIDKSSPQQLKSLNKVASQLAIEAGHREARYYDIRREGRNRYEIDAVKIKFEQDLKVLKILIENGIKANDFTPDTRHSNISVDSTPFAHLLTNAQTSCSYQTLSALANNGEGREVRAQIAMNRRGFIKNASKGEILDAFKETPLSLDKYTQACKNVGRIVIPKEETNNKPRFVLDAETQEYIEKNIRTFYHPLEPGKMGSSPHN